MKLSTDYLALIIPVFFIFLVLEYKLAERRQKKHYFNYEGSVANVSIGIAERLINLFITTAFYQVFYWVYVHYAIFNIPNNWMVWIGLMLATDLVWYWYHRLGHEINFLWAAHIVHHQSEEFNLTVSARITTFQSIIRNVFYAILPLIGFHPSMVFTILLVHGAYSFFTHTQMIGKLGWLEHILITPSLHGIHHASDEKYLDKNYGDVFTFWDKLFGTFQLEEEKPKYGLTHPLRSYSFLWQHFHYYLELAEACRRVKGFRAKARIFFGSPALLDQDIRPVLEKKFLMHRAADVPQFKFRNYLNLQLIVSILLLTVFTALFSKLDVADKLFFTGFVLLTLINCGALMEQRKYIYYLECFRLILLIGYVLWKFDIFECIVFPAAVIIILEQVFQLSQIYFHYVLRYDKQEIQSS